SNYNKRRIVNLIFKEIYDAIKSKLKSKEFARYTGYYVEIIPPGKNIYNKPFIPSDNKTKRNRPALKNIRIIDGVSFYAIAAGRKYALQELFEAVSSVLVNEFKFKLSKEEADKYFELFKLAFIVK
ncbi:MAG: Eco47II family restriction endonuclease, partial [Actinomycetota bacterium]